MSGHSLRKILSLLLFASIVGCGGSATSNDPVAGANPPPGDNNPAPGGTPPPGDTPPGDTPPPGGEPPPDGQPAMTMSCIDGPDYLCSGGTILRTENGIALTDSGVQVYGISTSDLAADNPEQTSAFGLRLSSGGTAEVRLLRDAGGAVSKLNLMLRNLGLSWDGTKERPEIIETFDPTQGRVQLAADGTITSIALPDSSDRAFYDYGDLGPAGTQANYANNRYFPRAGNPSRCPPDLDPCPSTETNGVSSNAGDWRSGGARPDWASAIRLHGDGDVHAGDGPPDAEGNRTWLAGGTGIGIPFPGSKGYRTFANWGMQYANLTSWTTQDTVLLNEWANLGNEHNKNRRGVVAFGDVTVPALVPASGTARYSGIAYGWHAPTSEAEPEVFWGNVVVSANFTTREVGVSIQDTVTYDETGAPVPASFTATTTMGSLATNSANYATGAASSGTLNGGVSARYFGPVAAGGNGNPAPTEIGGAFHLSNSTSGEVVVGGFVARRD